MIRVVLLGSGNVASYLFDAFSASASVEVVQVYNHAEESLSKFRNQVPVTTSLTDLAQAEVYVIAVKDDAISEVSQALTLTKGLVVHTSGAASLEVLKSCERRGVFYPLQTFSKNKAVKNKNIPFCLEAFREEDLAILKKLVEAISGTAYEVSSAQRRKLHLAAVFVCNFVNHLYVVGENICQENELPFEILQPLILETAEKTVNSSPRVLQTGPAKRNDLKTINAHLELLTSEENKKIYQLLTLAIRNLDGKKL